MVRKYQIKFPTSFIPYAINLTVPCKQDRAVYFIQIKIKIKYIVFLKFDVQFSMCLYWSVQRQKKVAFSESPSEGISTNVESFILNL